MAATRHVALGSVFGVLLLTTNAYYGGEVSVEKTCYEYDEEIIISFEIDDPGSDDWVGIYPADDVAGDLEPLMWLWSCGTQACWGKTDSGVFTFGGGAVNADYVDEWPLDNGRYRVVIGRNGEVDDMYYDIFSISEEFIVKRFNAQCGTFEPTFFPTMLLTPEPTFASPTNPSTKVPTTASPTILSPGSTTGSPSTYHPTTLQPATEVPTTESPITTLPTGTPTRSMASIIAAAKTDIAYLILREPSLSALFLRMVFNDCIGGCDGCINLSNPKNRMLGYAMDILAPTVKIYEPLGLSRPDIWVLASFTGVEMSMPQDNFLPLPFNYVGRQPCNAKNMTQGPNRDICSASMGTNDLVSFFHTNFGFTPKEVAAIMGAHTIGVMHRENLGYDGSNGWTLDNNVFNNGYYLELVGPGTDVDSQVNRAPNWQQRFVDNAGLSDAEISNVFQWEGWPGGRKIVMLNSDIALVRQLHHGNKAANGKVGCQFVPRGGSRSTCPMARSDLFSEMVHYRNNNQAFLEDFRDALAKLTRAGYAVDSSSCDANGICKLRKN